MEKIQKLIRFPKDLVEAIETYQEKNGIATFTASALELLRKALKAEGLFCAKDQSEIGRAHV